MVPLHRLFTVCCLCASVFPQYTHLCMYMCMYMCAGVRVCGLLVIV